VRVLYTDDRLGMGRQPNVAGLILAGSAEFKTELNESDLFDPRLRAVVIKTVDVSYGGENGFNQAIELAQESLLNVKFVQEKKLIQTYFDLISLDTNRYCFGVADTFKALEQGAVETLIVWENLEVMRYQLKNPQSGGTLAPPPCALITRRTRQAAACTIMHRDPRVWVLRPPDRGGTCARGYRGKGGDGVQGAGRRLDAAQGP
jgi:hypothetical protein